MLVASLSLVAHANKISGTPYMAHTKLQCAAKKLLHRPSMSTIGTFKHITCNLPDPKGSPRLSIIPRCVLPASLLDDVAKARWDFNGMNGKGELAVDGAKDTRECWLRSQKILCDLPIMFFTGAPQTKLPVDACCKP